MTLPSEQKPAPLYPENLLACRSEGKPWRLAQVKSRREKALANFEAESSISYYVPMYWRAQASKKGFEKAWYRFSRASFFKADNFDCFVALRTNHIAGAINVKNPVTPLRELCSINQALPSDQPVFPVAFLYSGQLVRITKGPLMDVEGIILQKDRGCRLILSLSNIQQSISNEIAADWVEPVR